MKAMLFRTSSGSVLAHVPHVSGSPRLAVSISVQDLTAIEFSSSKKTPCSSRSSLHMDVVSSRIKRSSSESDIIRSQARMITKQRTRSFDAQPVILEELGFPGGGMNKNRSTGGGGGDENRGDIGAYYETMIRSDPMNALLLRNYGKYLHEVEENFVKAEEYYGRAILASPGDEEVLSLYGKLIWETQKDESRAKSYFHQALQVSPNDCSILGSYAHFMWEAEEEQDEVEQDEVVTSSVMVEAF